MTQELAAEKILFLKDFLLNPAKIGSITPSSSYLTEKLLASLPWERFNVIVELGAGTGVFTEYAAAHKRPDSVFLVIEQDPQMQKALKARFPQVLFGSQAEDLPALMRLHNLPKADCIISGLPFAVIEKKGPSEDLGRYRPVPFQPREIRGFPIFVPDVLHLPPDLPEGKVGIHTAEPAAGFYLYLL